MGMTNTKRIKFDLRPKGMEPNNFDLDVHISNDNFGAVTDKLNVVGYALLKNGTEYNFAAPLIF